MNLPMNITAKMKMAESILKWHQKGYLMGPYPATHSIANDSRIDPVFCVPKPNVKVRPVVNHSKKNDLLDPALCTVEYIELKEIVHTMQQIGTCALL